MTPPHQSSSTNNRHNHRHPPPQNQTSLLGYLILLIPLFLFIYPPLSRTFLSQDSSSSKDPSSQSSSSLHTSNGDEVEGQSQNELFPGYAEDDNDDDGDLMLGGGGLKCPEHRFRGVYVYSVEPLVIYLEGFLSEGECDEIIELSDPHFSPATIWDGTSAVRNPTIRSSEVALLPRTELIRCLEARARSFQGWLPNIHIERLRSQRYAHRGDHYGFHYDWTGRTLSADRVSTFMVYVEAKNLSGGGTHFPRVPRREEGRWCEWVYCPPGRGSVGEGEGLGDGPDKESGMDGVVFRSIKGNAVFWENLDADGRGYWETYHRALPVKEGVKIGLNVWSWGKIGEK